METDMRVIGAELDESPRARRGYDNTRRIEQAAQTSERIISAALELIRRSSIRDWRGVTVRAVADRAGVSERTVYRHFGAERGVRDAVMRRLEEQAGIDLASLRLEDVAEIAERTLRTASAYPRPPKPELDPTLVDANQRQHDALIRAVTAETGDWAEPDRVLAAAVLDVLWSLASYERLAVDWQCPPDDAIRGLTWAIRLVQRAVASGEPLSD
jgi:AcrR family transcriptional regulator